MNIISEIHRIVDGSWLQDDLPEAVARMWLEMTEDQQYKFLNDTLDDAMKEECVAHWEE